MLLVNSGSYVHTVDCWMLAGMVAVCEQYYCMIRVSYYVVSSVTGCSKCLATVGLTLGITFCHGFVSLYIEIYLVHWAHRIEGTNTLNVDVYYHLFNSPIVRTQLQRNFREREPW